MQRLAGAENPGAFMPREADFGIIIDRFRRRAQNQHGARPHSVAGSVNQFDADAATLMRRVHRQIGEIADIGEISENARDADQKIAIPGGDDKVGMAQQRASSGQPRYCSITASPGLTRISRIFAGRLNGASRSKPLGLSWVREKKLTSSWTIGLGNGTPWISAEMS